jgi:hypothetical protein
MAISGSWDLFYDWQCGGDPNRFTITFNSDGTWSGFGYTGPWVELAGMVMFTFSDGGPVYAANTAGGSMTGVMNNFTLAGANGCWWAVAEGTSAASDAREGDIGPDGARRSNP